MPDDVTTVGELVITGRRVRFTYYLRDRPTPDPPLGGETSELPDTGGGGDTTEPPCSDLSGMTDAQKTNYLMRFLAQEIAYAMSQRPVQSMEYGSAIWRDDNGDYHFTSLIDTPDHRARINWSELPLHVNGHPDYGRVVGFVHSHPYENFNPTTGGVTTYYDPGDPTRLLRPHTGDWSAYDGLVTSMGGSTNVAGLMMYIYGYSESGAVGVPGSMSLHEYGPDDHGNTADVGPELDGLLPPCNE